MSIRNLDALFAPRSLVLVGASDEPRSVGATVMRNLLDGGFAGPIHAVNPRHRQVAGRPCYRRVEDLPDVPDLAVICTPAATVPALIEALGRRGTRAAVVMSAGLSRDDGSGTRTFKDAMLDAARPHLVRVLGPNGLGLIVPGIGLNASFAHRNATPGQLAFVTQSGALMTAVLDWAASRGIGFSKFISLGEGADVDFGDALDYLAGDPDTHAILLYAEAVTAARKFMSAARAAARNKPVIVVKSGRAPAGARAAFSHSGALAGSDAVYDAAIRRAGMLRVTGTEDLFDAVETLARARAFGGDRLAIVTNGGGPGVMATDELALGGGRLAELSDATRTRLDACLPATWSHGNPVDVIGDAPVARYVDALDALAAEPGADAILLIHAPTAIVPSAEIAAGVVEHARRTTRVLLTCWLGGDAVVQARETCAAAGLPTYETPEGAIRALLRLVEFRRNQELLVQVPAASAPTVVQDAGAAKAVVAAAIEAGRDALAAPEALAVLRAYGVPTVETRRVADAAAAASAAAELGFPVALKILSPQIVHKSDLGGVRLGLDSSDVVRAAAEAMLARVRSERPEAVVEGFSVQRMVARSNAHELLVGLAEDAVFGPVVVFGQGGTATERIGDRALALPPLDGFLARDLIGRTRVSRQLSAYRERAAADVAAVERVLIAVAQLAADLPIAELDINPLLADENGVVALDARIRLRASGRPGADAFAIVPYPAQLEERIDWDGAPLLLRPIKPDDAAAHLAFFDSLDPEDVRSRMFIRLRELPRSQLARLTQIDYDREMAFIATRQLADGGAETLGVVRALTDPDNLQAEFAIIVRSDLKGRGLGRILLEKIIAYARGRGTHRLVGETLSGNARMRALAQDLGFDVTFDSTRGDTRMALELGGPP